ncbi:MAG: LysE family translocator [Nitratireductor sp.]|nr:LysE family translocator [Nitratireductor sp.]
MTLESILLFTLALVVVTGSPGPSIAALVARVMQQGAASVLPFLAAMWVGEVIWLTAAILGLSAIAEAFHHLFLAIRYAGVAYLVYLAWRMWHSPVAEDVGDDLPRAESPGALFFSGLAVTIGNPKIMVFYLALLPGLIDVAAIGFADWLILASIALAVCAAVDLSWLSFASLARRFFRSRSGRRIVNRVSATAMAGAAGAIALRN